MPPSPRTCPTAALPASSQRSAGPKSIHSLQIPFLQLNYRRNSLKHQTSYEITKVTLVYNYVTQLGF